MTSIDEFAFGGCDKLERITLPFVGAALNGTRNTHFGYIFGASDYSYNNKYVSSNLKTVFISGNSGVTSIDGSAFKNCSGLMSITIPDSVTSIGYSAFEGCSGLTSITLPFIGATLNGGSSKAYLGYIFGANHPKYNNDYVPSNLKTVIISNGGGVTSIGYSAFVNCKGLTEVIIPDSVTSIDGSAFEECSGLTGITIPSSVTSIDASAFERCIGLTCITIPSSVTSIGRSAFKNCSGLTNIIIPDSVATIGERAFYWCGELTSITYNGTKAQWNAISKGSNWNYNTGKYTIYCTDGTISK